MKAPERIWTRCRVCDHVWFVAKPTQRPRQCPSCRTRRWAPVYNSWRKSGRPRWIPFGSLLCECSRCGWRWMVQNLTGEATMPRRCAYQPCATPYWHRPRTPAWAAKQPGADAAA